METVADAVARHRRRMEAFRWEVPDWFDFGRDVVDRVPPERPALLWRDAAGARRRLSFGEVSRASDRVARLLATLGLGPGDPVLVMLPRVPEWHVAVVGALKAGALVIPCSTLLRPKDLAFRAAHSGARLVLTSPDQAGTVDAARGELSGVRHFFLSDAAGATRREGFEDWEAACAGQPAGPPPGPRSRASDPALVYYTSGTTGPPKAVLHAHAWTFAQRYTALHWLGVRAEDRLWTTSDTGWAKAAYSVLFGPWSVGAEVCLYHGRFEPRRELELLAEFAPRVFCAPPTEFRLLVKEDFSRHRSADPRGLAFSFLREVVSAGEPLNPEVIRAWHEHTGHTIRDGYGQTETILLVGNFPGMPVKPGSMGLPNPGHRVEVIDGEGRVLPPGEVGDVAVHGDPPSLFRGYWKDPEASARCRRGDWYVTGDRAFRDDDGYFWFVGRADDLIISAGYRIGPFEVESALVEHPAVVEAAVVAAPDPDRGSIVKAYVVLRPGVTPSDELVAALQDHVKRVTAPYKYPRAVEFVAELPKTVSGKIRRVELRQRAEETR
jgi:acetyl-CoA synthetase/medium-chain acyl-CoA synthetase